MLDLVELPLAICCVVGSIPADSALEVWPSDFAPKPSGWLTNQLGIPHFYAWDHMRGTSQDKSG
jgi:hypothetical protein